MSRPGAVEVAPSPPTDGSSIGRPLRVLCIKDQISDAGGSVYFLRTLPLLDSRRVRVTMCALRPWHPMGARFDAAGIPTCFLGRSKWDPRSLLDVQRQIQIHDPDILHLEGRKTLLAGRLAARLSGRPAIIHGHEMLPLTGPMAILQRQLAPWTAKAIVVSEAVGNFVNREFAIVPERIEVLHNGLDIDRFRSTDSGARTRIRAELGVDGERPLVGVVGRIITSIKGQDILIRAMARVLTQRPDAALAVVGDGPDLEACRALAAKLGIGDAVRFMGRRDDIPEILAAIDVAAVPSVCDEGFPFVAIEALAAGRPVVAFRSGGVPEIVEDGVCGIVVAQGDEAGLANGLLRLLDNADLHQRMATASLARARTFATQPHVDRLTAIYEEVAAEHQAARN